MNSQELVLPTLPHSDAGWSFPLVGSLTPVLLSLGMWVITQSPMALIFAGLGPVMAIGSYCDARRTGRKKRRSESERFSRELRHSEVHGERIHAAERQRLDALLPSATRIVAGTAIPRALWRSAVSVELALTLGRGERRSGIGLQGVRPKPQPESAQENALAALIVRLRTVQNIPVELLLSANSPTSGIGVYGPEPVASAYVRSLLVQILRSLSPSRYGISLYSPNNHSGTAAWEWLAELPHPLNNSDRGVTVEGRIDIRVEPLTPRAAVGRTTQGGEAKSEHTIVISIARNAQDLPAELDVVVALDGASGSGGSATSQQQSRIVQHTIPARQGAIVIEVISIEQAVHWARTLSLLATRDGFVGRKSGAIPERVMLADVLARTSTRVLEHSDTETTTSETTTSETTTSEKLAPVLRPPLRSLACAFAVGPDGDEMIDLVIDGPHGIVGGTTGSGKSELLISWVTAMAARYAPEEVNFLLVDYKGGASFEALRHLPHCVGMLTDLDEATSKRALDSLAAELRFRERALATAGAKSIVDPGVIHGLARLVIVVDEFAAMAAEHPELHALFSDIAARGRSLGVHLILCTQRPAGVIRDAVLANSALRISLRVNNSADSAAVVGDDSAARLPSRILGRAVLARAGEPARLLQLGLQAPSDINNYVRSPALGGGAATARPLFRRPWLDPLAPIIALRPLLTSPGLRAPVEPEVSLVFGRSDYPEDQAQPLARYQPHKHGHLLVLGDSLSGKSTALTALCEAASMIPLLDTVRVAPGIDALWDTVTLELARIRGSGLDQRRLLVLDDVDALLARAGDDYERELAERLIQLLREGPSAGVYCVISMRRIAGTAGSVATMMGARLVLAHSSRQEFILAGGSGDFFQQRMSPGRAQWQEHAAQVALPTESAGFTIDGPQQTVSFDTTGSFAVVTPDPVSLSSVLIERFSTSGSDHEVVILGPSGIAVDPSLAITSGPRPRVIIGSPEKWQSFWGALETVSTQWPVLLIGCSVGDFRSLTRGRVLPPPLDSAPGDGWLLRPGKPVTRARFS